MTIKFLDLQKINARHREELRAASGNLIDSGWYVHGNAVAAFEKELAEYTGCKHAIGVANGLDALSLILRGYLELGKLKKGDEVLVPANTYIASILAISENELVPVLVEPSGDTFNIDPAKIQEAITPKTKALLNVHLYGRISFSDELKELIGRYGLLHIEDNAQAIGAEWENVRSGNLGDASGFSFYPGKNLGALGDGGAVCTNDDKLAEAIRAIANYGSVKKYYNTFKGVNSRLDELQAAFLSVKLPFLDSGNNRRREIAAKYLAEITHPLITLPHVPGHCSEHVWHLFVIRCDERDKLQQFLAGKGIQTLIHYPVPPHKQEAYREWNDLSYPVSELIHRTVLSIPISPVMTDEEVGYVIKTINSF